MQGYTRRNQEMGGMAVHYSNITVVGGQACLSCEILKGIPAGRHRRPFQRIYLVLALHAPA